MGIYTKLESQNRLCASPPHWHTPAKGIPALNLNTQPIFIKPSAKTWSSLSPTLKQGLQLHWVVKLSEDLMHKASLWRRPSAVCQSSAGSNQNCAESTYPQTHPLVSVHPEVSPEHRKMHKMRTVLSYGSSTPSSSNHHLPPFLSAPHASQPTQCLTHQKDPLHFILSTTHQLIINQTQIKPIFPSSSPKPLIAHYPALCSDTKVILLSGEFCCCFFFHKNC